MTTVFNALSFLLGLTQVIVGAMVIALAIALVVIASLKNWPLLLTGLAATLIAVLGGLLIGEGKANEAWTARQKAAAQVAQARADAAATALQSLQNQIDQRDLMLKQERLRNAELLNDAIDAESADAQAAGRSSCIGDRVPSRILRTIR